MSLTEESITRLVNLFYGRVRKDPILSPIFLDKIGDDDVAWGHHVQHIADFWSSIFLKTGRFSGNPMRKHTGLKSIAPHHFERWLSLFEGAATEALTQTQAEEVMGMANRIAQSLQMGLAFHNDAAGQSSNPFSNYSAVPAKSHQTKLNQ